MLTEPWLNFRFAAVTICHNDLVWCQNRWVINRTSQASHSPELEQPCFITDPTLLGCLLSVNPLKKKKSYKHMHSSV